MMWPELLYPIAVFAAMVSGSALIFIAWFLWRHCILDIIDWVYAALERAIYRFMDLVTGVKGEVDEGDEQIH